MTSNVEEADGKLVTNRGGEITSPETLVAEFQARYFDDRDGEAVAELWDDGYSAEGFQQTIDESLKNAPENIEWCLTVMPGDLAGGQRRLAGGKKVILSQRKHEIGRAHV